MKIKITKIDPKIEERKEVVIEGLDIGDSVRIELEDNGKMEEVSFLKITKNKTLNLSK